VAIIAEIGIDMTVFGNAKRLAALSNRAPTVKPFLAKPLYAMAAVARPDRG
jgi:hypothetical protein